MRPVRPFDDWYSKLLLQRLDVQVFRWTGPHKTSAEMDDLGPFVFQTLCLGHNFVSFVSSTSAANVEADQFDLIVGGKSPGPVTQCWKTVPAGAIDALFLTPDYAHFRHEKFLQVMI